MDKKKRKLKQLIAFFSFLGLLFIVGTFNSRQTPEERISELIKRHWGVILFVQSGTEKDAEVEQFLDHLREKIRGSASVVTLKPEQSAFLGAETQRNAPALVIIEAHGQELNRFYGPLSQEDRTKVLESVNKITWHQQVSKGKY